MTTGGGYCSSCGWRAGPAIARHSDVSAVALATGLLVGLIVGYSVVASVHYLSDPPYSIIWFALVYGLGLAVLLVSMLPVLVFPELVKKPAFQFSVAFAGAYYFTEFVTMWIRV